MFWLSPKVTTIRDLLEREGAESVSNKYGRKACESLLELIKAPTTSNAILLLGIESLALISEQSANRELMRLAIGGENAEKVSEAIRASDGAYIDQWLTSILTNNQYDNATRSCATKLLGNRPRSDNQSVLIEALRSCEPDNHLLISALIEAIECSGWRPSEFEAFLLRILQDYIEQEMIVKAALGSLVRALRGQTHDLHPQSPLVQILDTLARIGGQQSLAILRSLQDKVRSGALFNPLYDEEAIMQKARKGGVTDDIMLGIFKDDYRNDRDAVLKHLTKAVQKLEEGVGG